MIKVRFSVFSPPSFFCRHLKDCLEPFRHCKNMQFYAAGVAEVTAAVVVRASRLKRPVCHFGLVIYFFLLFNQYNNQNPFRHSSASRLQNKEWSLKKNLCHRPRHAGRGAEVVEIRGDGVELAVHSLLTDPGCWNAARR